jgi:DNA-binding transcriptional regulator YhcF (GntR family)
METSVDRRLGVSIRPQIKDLMEYGLACGELVPGEKLPSARDLAKQAGVAPMTIVQVCAELKDQGLIKSWPGLRTGVTARGPRCCRAPAHSTCGSASTF